MLQGFYYYYYYLAWSITATVEPRGACHRKGKDITFTVKKSLYMMSFPPSFPSRGGSDAEPEPVVLARGGGGSCDAAWCFWVCKSRVHPSPFLCCVLFFFSTGGKKKEKGAILKKLQTPAAKQCRWVYKWYIAEFSCSPWREPCPGTVGRSGKVARSSLQQISHISMYVHTCASV